MYRFYLAAIDMLPGVLLLIPLYWLLNRVYFRNAGNSILYCLFSCYLSVVYVLVGLPNVTYIRPELNLNLIPFAGIIEDWKNSILNILLFVPLGIFLPLLWHRFRSAKRTVPTGFFTSVAIELLQILTFRATDVNDLITNTLGTYLGFLTISRLQRRFPILNHVTAADRTLDPVIVLCATFLVMFFVYPFISAGLWDFILS